jgi:hypothetical protein
MVLGWRAFGGCYYTGVEGLQSGLASTGGMSRRLIVRPSHLRVVQGLSAFLRGVPGRVGVGLWASSAVANAEQPRIESLTRGFMVMTNRQGTR